MSENISNDGVTVSFKATTGYDSPMIVFKGSSVADVADKVAAAEASGLFALIANADTTLKAEWVANKGVGAVPVDSPGASQPQGQYQQQGQQQPPWQGQQQQGGNGGGRGPVQVPAGVQVPTCPHGTKRLVNGQYGPFWGCPAQRDDPSKCKIEKYHGPPLS